MRTYEIKACNFLFPLFHRKMITKYKIFLCVAGVLCLARIVSTIVVFSFFSEFINSSVTCDDLEWHTDEQYIKCELLYSLAQSVLIYNGSTGTIRFVIASTVLWGIGILAVCVLWCVPHCKKMSSYPKVQRLCLSVPYDVDVLAIIIDASAILTLMAWSSVQMIHCDTMYMLSPIISISSFQRFKIALSCCAIISCAELFAMHTTLRSFYEDVVYAKHYRLAQTLQNTSDTSEEESDEELCPLHSSFEIDATNV